MQLDNGLQDAIQNTDWLLVLSTYWDTLGPYQTLIKGIGFAFVVVIVLMVTVMLLFPSNTVDPDAPPVAKRTRRWWWQKPGIPFSVGSEVIDLQPRKGDAIHTAIGGTTGTGKTSALLPLLDLDVGVLLIAMDNVTPLRARIAQMESGREWTNEPECPCPWNMLAGLPELVSEQLVAGWPHSQDTGHYRRIARFRIWDRLEQADRDGEVRSFAMLIDCLMTPVDSPDPMVNRACREWGTKLSGMYRVLGHTAIGGPGDLDLVEAMRKKQKVLMRLNAYLHPEDAPTLGGMLLVHARRVAQEAGVPFVLVVEEAGMLDAQQEHIKPLAQAARDRGVSLVMVTQNLSRLPPEVRNNISCWISFAQEDDVETKFAANRLRLKPHQLWREAFKDEGRRWAYVKSPGVPTSLVRITEVKPLKVRQPQVSRPEPVVVPDYAYAADRFEQPALNHWVQYPNALPPPGEPEKERPPWWVGTNPDMLRFWGQMRRTHRETPLWHPDRGVWWGPRWMFRMAWSAEQAQGQHQAGSATLQCWSRISDRVRRVRPCRW